MTIGLPYIYQFHQIYQRHQSHQTQQPQKQSVLLQFL